MYPSLILQKLVIGKMETKSSPLLNLRLKRFGTPSVVIITTDKILKRLGDNKRKNSHGDCYHDLRNDNIQ